MPKSKLSSNISCVLILIAFFLISMMQSPVYATLYLGWDPLPSDLLPSEYDALYLGDDPANWTWSTPFTSEIKDVYVAAPIHPIAYEPVMEYNGSHDNFSVDLAFYSPGAYIAKVDFIDDYIEDHIQFLYVNSYPAKKDKVKNHSRQVKIEQPLTPDVIIIEDPVSDNGAIKNAAEAIDGEVRAGTVAEAIQRVKDAYANSGNQPVDVDLVAHGTSNAISVGAGDKQVGLHPDKELFDNSQAVKKFIAELNGKVSSLTLKGCNVAAGVDDPGRDHLMEHLADGLWVPVYAWDMEIFWTAPWEPFGVVTLREGYASIDVHGNLHKTNPIPESGTMLLLGTGLVAFAGFRKEFRRKFSFLKHKNIL